ncbi:MAG TPA: SUMF1/EgtB/PvdO family nonheme iron enzyme, partial [Phycisphaerae bacterium]|nr:SUMF1/EgtB/PvdO family nonheme iron enzyme [Phycisphaerae bacterium]
EKDVVYGTVGGQDLKLDYYVPVKGANAAMAALVRIGPAREAVAGAGPELLGRGYVLVYAGYVPGEAKNVAFDRFPQDVQAAKAAVRWVRANAGKLGIEKDKIAVWGAGHGASVAALLGVTPDQKDLNGTIGSYVAESTAVRALCLFEGVTDWRNAELYGDEEVNFPGSPAYQLFGGNPKERPATGATGEDAARLPSAVASAVNYVRPTSPATLMVTLASDRRRAMHQIFAETLKKAGVPSALYEQPTAGVLDHVNEENDTRVVVQFFDDVMRGEKGNPRSMTLAQEIDQLTAAGLYKQARRLINEQIMIVSDDPARRAERTGWLTKLNQIGDLERVPALQQLQAVRKATTQPDPRMLWTIREVLTDPERIGKYDVEATLPQAVFNARADALRFVEMLNGYLARGDAAGAERQARVMQDVARKGDADPAILNEFLTRYADIKGRTSHVWPPALRGAAFASDYGQDLYGYWMEIKSGNVTQRLRYIPPGNFTMGSAKDEWGRLPGEPILEPTAIPRGFWLGDSEVTQGLYEAVMGPAENRSAFRVSGSGAEVRVKLPVENISYAHAVNFLNKLGVEARLPSEAEWEYACRAGSNFMYSGTGRLSDMAWFWDEAKKAKDGSTPGTPAVNEHGEVDVRILHELEMEQSDVARLTHPVKLKLPNHWGLYDMQGNVWEWCSGTSATQPRDYHAARGGSWLSIPQSCRAARDVWLPVEEQAWNLGMRICITAQ